MDYVAIVLAGSGIGQFERRVRKAESEGKERRDSVCIEPAVSHEQAFAIKDAMVHRWVRALVVCAFQGSWECRRQLATGIRLSEQDLGDRLIADSSRIPCLHNRAGSFRPSGHVDSGPGVVHDDRIRIESYQ